MTRRHTLPAEIYALVEQTPGAVLLEGVSSTGNRTNEPAWTQLFLAPSHICEARTLGEIPGVFAAVDKALAKGECAAGFFAYECAEAFEANARSIPFDHRDRPLAWFGIYPRRYVFDHETGQFAGGEPPELNRVRQELEKSPESSRNLRADFTLTQSEYAQRIAQIHEYIRCGDVYQLNFTAPFQIRYEGGVADHYAQLRRRQPVAYGAFLHWRPERYVLSFSPELFFRIDRDGDRRVITTRPMKGTVARGKTSQEDRAAASWLQNDEKNRSENLMIVDLLRNDLGRIAKFGSVAVRDLFSAERYPTLWQMTSTINADLRPEIGNEAIFRALFPCGSVTGAPKIRAMQLLAELESTPRGVYTGAIGFFSREQTVFNVAIRTLELADGRGTFGAGSGVVIDSEPVQEFQECQLKGAFLRDPLGQSEDAVGAAQSGGFSLIESLLWNGAYPLLELHLDRLTDSADYFGFVCDREAVRDALVGHTGHFGDAAPRKVRLLLDEAGTVQIESEILPPAPKRTGRVCVSPRHTEPADPTLFHKTTQRALYNDQFAKSAVGGFDDVLFLNIRGEVTEGAISNIFVEKDRRWSTPAIHCGVLPGVYRRYLLETKPEIEECTISLDDLKSADKIYIANAVRGLRQVDVDFLFMLPVDLPDDKTR